MGLFLIRIKLDWIDLVQKDICTEIQVIEQYHLTTTMTSSFWKVSNINNNGGKNFRVIFSISYFPHIVYLLVGTSTMVMSFGIKVHCFLIVFFWPLLSYPLINQNENLGLLLSNENQSNWKRTYILIECTKSMPLYVGLIYI